ncbi:MAG: PEP-CTERM sorting domain-containing protein [Pirellulales bacterium]|nr:PEP-CTERM sorting domain-containing protein [Pirellulales bacterium]
MKYCLLLSLCLVMAISGVALAESGTAYVATANGSNAFTINNAGGQLFYHVQPDTNYNWYYEDGSLVTYTYGGVTANRDGMKTFAATDVAYGATFGSLKLDFQYASSTYDDGNGYPFHNYPTINVHITDGLGHYAIWSATSGGTGFTTAAVPGRDDWMQLSLDCTAFADDSVFGKVNESTDQTVLVNGNLNSTAVQWSDIKDWTIAGFYTEQFAPTGDWGAWGENLWSDINAVGQIVPDNHYGISLVWGDTVGSMYGDYDNTYVGALAERPYGQGVKMIDNLVVGAGGTDYDISFVADVAPVPEPGTLTLLGLLGLSALMLVRRRRGG